MQDVLQMKLDEGISTSYKSDSVYLWTMLTGNPITQWGQNGLSENSLFMLYLSQNKKWKDHKDTMLCINMVKFNQRQWLLFRWT